MYVAIDHHKAVFAAAKLDAETGVTADERFEGSRDGLLLSSCWWDGEESGHGREAQPSRPDRTDDEAGSAVG